MTDFKEATFFKQLKAMVWRNFLLKKREKRKTTAEIVLPLYTLSILILLKLVIPNPHFPAIESPRGEASIFEYFQNLRNHTVAVVPNTTDVQKFLQLVNELWQTMHQDPGYYPINWNLFATKQDLITNYWQDPLSIPLAVIFEEPGPLNGQLVYEIKINPAVSQTPATTELFTSPANCRQIESHWSNVLPIESGDSCPVNQYYYSGFVALQALIDYTKIRFDTGRNDIHVPHISLEIMPKGAHTADWLLAVRVVIPLYMVMAVSQFITYLLILIVGEKERKIKEGMKIMGLRDSAFWLSWFLIYAVFVTILSAICCFILYGLKVFAHTNHWLLFLLITLYSYTIIMFGFMITPFFDKSRTAGVIGSFAVTIMSFLYYIQVFVDKSQTCLFWLLSLISSSGFALAMDKALVQDMAGIGLNLDNMWSGPGISFGGSLIMMILDIFLYALLAYYLDSVIPSEHGTRRPVFFFLSKSYWFPKDLKKKIPTGISHDEENNPDVEPVPSEMKGKEAIRISDIFKVFKSCRKPELRAVNGINLTIYEGQITAILGHNGAGKTTLINMLTGLTQPTSGTAYIFGYDIRNQNDMDQIRRMTGVCPQHDILFDNLTVREHLDFFASIKGIPSAKRKLEIGKILKDIDLTDKADTFSKYLSGGQKRKLSIGIAIIGDPKIIFLDEPTAGVDPYSRRHMWSVLQNIRHGKVILLTTHFMDEADILAERKAVVSKGRLRCCGSSLFLKNKFGIGYHLTLVLGNTYREDGIVNLVSNFVPKAEKARRHGKELSFILPYNDVENFAKLFSAIEAEISREGARFESGDSKNLGITSYGISMTTLEEVFLHLERNDGENDEESETVDDLSKKMVRDRALSRSLSLQSKSTSYHSLQNEGTNSLDRDRMLNDSQIKGLELHCDVSPNFIQTLTALIKLRILRLLRDFRKLYITIGVPLLFAAGGVIFLPKMMHSIPKSNSLILNGSTYGRLTTVIVQNRSEKDLNYFVSGFKDLGANSLTFYDGNFSSLLEIAPKMAALNVTVFDDPEFNITAIYNDTMQHSLPVLINFITNALYKMQSFESEDWRPISVSTEPFQLTTQPPGVNFTTFVLACFLGMLFVLVPISLAIDIVYDREIKAKNQLRVNGLSLGMYFLTFFIVQIVLMVLISAALLFIILLENVPSLHQWPAVIVLGGLIFFYCIPGILFSTCLNYMFDKTDSAQSIMPNAVTCIGLIPFIVVGMLDMLGISRVVVMSLHTVFSLLNTMYIPYSIFYYVQRTYMICGIPDICNTLTISHYMTTEIYVIIIGMVVQIPIYSVVLVVVDILKSGGHISEVFKRFVSNTVEFTNNDDVDVGLNEDADVKSERVKVANILNTVVAEPPVVLVHNLHKEYKKSYSCRKPNEEVVKTAIQSLSLAVDAGEVFGLLGHNGAGKTTTMKIIIAEEVPTRGRVQIDGHNIHQNTDRIFKLLGYCPQHDALWKNITVKEHLECYASIRGVPKKFIPTAVYRRLCFCGAQVVKTAANLVTIIFNDGHVALLNVVEDLGTSIGEKLFNYCREIDRKRIQDAERYSLNRRVEEEMLLLDADELLYGPGIANNRMIDLYLSGLQIHEHADKKAYQCSGGTKRKLSYAMAMIGNPKVVLLDEPSTGMDPKSKRFLWDTILASFQGKRGAILTTHSMEEADALCSRVGIMVKGELRCLGSTQHLKNLYGAGYTLEIKLKASEGPNERLRAVQSFVSALFADATLEESFADRLVFSVPQKSVKSLAKAFTELERAKTEFQIEEYSFSQTTLEQVFLKFAQYDEVNEEE